MISKQESYELGYETFQKALRRGDYRVGYKGEATFRRGWEMGKLGGVWPKEWMRGWDDARREAEEAADER